MTDPPLHPRERKALAAFGRGLWRQRSADLPRRRAWPLRILRVVLLAAGRFWRHGCPLRASALTFYTLLALVPVAALALGIAKGFGLQRILEREVLRQLAGQQEVAAWILETAGALLDSTSGGVVAGIGSLLLLWSLVKVLHHIESSFNLIWEVPTARGAARRLGDYLALALLGTLLLTVAGSARLLLTARVTVLASLGSAWLFFTLAYRMMPNTRVPWSSAMVAGLAAGSAFQLLQWLYFLFQSNAAQYNAVYGSLAALPLFMIWLELSWSIVLFGAEISFAQRHAGEYELEPAAEEISLEGCKGAALAICRLVVQRFTRGLPPMAPAAIAAATGIPVRLARRVCSQLVAAGLLCPTCPGPAEGALLPTRPAEDYRLATVGRALDRLGRPADPLWSIPTGMAEVMERFDDALRAHPENRRLVDLPEHRDH